MIKLEGLTKRYKKKDVLKDLDFEVQAGEMIAIMGKSGIGKTTFLNILGFLDYQTSGTYILDGEDTSKLSISKKNKYRNEKVNYVLQNYALINSYTVYENMEIPLEIRNIKPSLRREIIKEKLDQLDIGDLIDEKIANLSGGEKQRVAIARCLVNDVKVLLADEPTGNLDNENSKKVMELLRNLNLEQGKTIIIVTHSKDIALLCDKVYTIEEGKIILKSL